MSAEHTVKAATAAAADGLQGEGQEEHQQMLHLKGRQEEEGQQQQHGAEAISDAYGKSLKRTDQEDGDQQEGLQQQQQKQEEKSSSYDGMQENLQEEEQASPQKQKPQQRSEQQLNSTKVSQDSQQQTQPQRQQQQLPFPLPHKAPPVEVKLFVGRVPQSVQEDQLRDLFSEFGIVTDCSVIREKNTMKHRNSAFVRMSSLAFADAAIRALHGMRALEEGAPPLAVKYASGEAARIGLSAAAADGGIDKAKLFVGSIPRNATEDELKVFFSSYGTVDEVFVLRDSGSGGGKGCAFVKYRYKEEALYAIRSLSGRHTFAGCSRPVDRPLQQPQKITTRGRQAPGESISHLTACRITTMRLKTSQRGRGPQSLTRSAVEEGAYGGHLCKAGASRPDLREQTSSYFTFRGSGEGSSCWRLLEDSVL
ncbi:RNA recognition motif domain-containing protein [Cyclospora cayetanensis]|uniref:RNA recognition motif domain-containing protein n=1 Tax=Cyclospora cayetanensis TaxID=88456 RepID=A0A1D3CVP4_9EIME|nr:RNA recognition motif domain-containing protein [Cyclospora cayetanensis]